MRNRYVLILDLPLIALAALGAFILRFDWLFVNYRPEFVPFLIAAVITKPMVFALFGLYRRYWAYATVADLVAIVVSACTASVVLGLGVTIGVATRQLAEFGRTILLLDLLLTIAAVGGFRFSIRLLNDRRARGLHGPGAPRRAVLVVGAGTEGMAVLREIERNHRLGLEPVGMLDDDPVKKGKRIHGVRVLGRLADLATVIETYGIQEVIITMPGAAKGVIRGVAQVCAAAGIVSRTLPGMFELLDGRVSVQRLREVEIADLLRRPEILSPVGVASYVTGRTVLVTGAGGSIGLELCRQVAHARPSRLVLLGHGENSVYEAEQQLVAASQDVPLETVIADVRDTNRVRSVFDDYRPAIVFHAAAHKHVPLMERNPSEAITNNVLGTSNIADAAVASGVERLVLISTDKAVQPRSVMGASKRVAEQIVRDTARRSGRPFAVVRFGNVLGSRGSVVPHFKRQIEMGGPVTITHPEMTRFFMTIPEAVHLVLQAGGMATGGELFVLNMGEPVSIRQLAEDLIALSGYSTDDIPIICTGMRPGEKLEERLWEEDAVVSATNHPDILHVAEPEVSTDMTPSLDSFRAVAAGGNRREIELLLSQRVGSYVPTPREVAAEAINSLEG